MKAGTCAHNRRALQQLALNVHIKHSDLTFSFLISDCNIWLIRMFECLVKQIYPLYWQNTGCGPPNSMLLGRRSRCSQLLIQHFTKSWNAIGDICEKLCCHMVLFYVVNNFLWFDLSQCLCSRYHDIQKIAAK